MKSKLFPAICAALLFGSLSYAQPGTWKQVGNGGAWLNTIFAVSNNGGLYTIEKSGALYRSDPATGNYTLITKENYINTAAMFAGDKNIFTIENDGSLYRT